MLLNVLSHEIKIFTISHIHFVLFQFKDLSCLLENPVEMLKLFTTMIVKSDDMKTYS